MVAQRRSPDGKPVQRIDEQYTSLIKQHLQDPRISTELVDHLPASDKVPTPLKFFGRIVGTPGELTYAKDIHRYYQALARGLSAREAVDDWHHRRRPRHRRARDRRRGDHRARSSATSGTLDALTDPRKTSDARGAGACIADGKPIYYLTSGMHSPENGGPEMLIELAYRLIVEETPFIQNIRDNVITFITPVLEVGRPRKAGRHLLLQQAAPGRRRAAAADVLGQVRRSTTTTATAWASSSS